MRFSFIIFAVLLIAGCRNSENKIPDVSHIQVDLKIHRFDQDLRAIDTNHLIEGVKALETKYPEFTDFYFSKIIAVKKPGDNAGLYRTQAASFLRFAPTRFTLDTIQIVFKDFGRYQKELEQGFRFYKYYLPEKQIPEVYTMPTDFNYAAVIPPFNNALALGLDMYLGPGFQAYQTPDLPRFLVRTYDKDYLTLRAFKALLGDAVPPPAGNRLIDLMIQNGKQMYAIDLILPDMPDSIKWEWTQKQTAWVKENEVNIWSHLVDKKLLYSSNMMDINKLINDSPNSPGMPPEAPGRTANFIGYKIVKEYMRRNPGVALSVLLNMNDVQHIMDGSKYKPDR